MNKRQTKKSLLEVLETIDDCLADIKPKDVPEDKGVYNGFKTIRNMVVAAEDAANSGDEDDVRAKTASALKTAKQLIGQLKSNNRNSDALKVLRKAISDTIAPLAKTLNNL